MLDLVSGPPNTLKQFLENVFPARDREDTVPVAVTEPRSSHGLSIRSFPQFEGITLTPPLQLGPDCGNPSLWHDE